MAQPGSTSDEVTAPPDYAHSHHDARVGADQLLALIDNTSAVIYMRDIDGRYMLVNQEYERLFGVSRENIIGSTDYDIFPAIMADTFRANDIQAIKHGSPIQVEETAPGEDGVHTYLTVKFPLLDARGEAYAICGISTDITDRKRAEEEVAVLNSELERRVLERTAELELSTSELSACAYSVSHDLRAPLRSLHGFSQLLMDDYAGVLDDTGVGHLKRLQANAARMAQIIDDLLRLSRMSRSELRREEIDLGVLAGSIHQELHLLEPDRVVEFTIEDDLRTTGDALLVGLALQNLMSNAWKFTARTSPAKISMGSFVQGSDSVFFVRDNGVGFDARYSKKLFEPFQRLHSTADFDGNGIGLAIVQRVIRRHGGDIWAESAPDQGAAFFFTMAAATDPDESKGHDAD